MAVEVIANITMVKLKTKTKNPVPEIMTSLKSVFASPTYLAVFLVLSLISLTLFVFIPVKTIPGNSLALQLSIFATKDYLLMVFLALAVALFLTMQIFIFRNSIGTKTKLASLGKGGLGGYTGIIGALFATATCAACLFALLGFLGLSTIIFLVNIRWYIVIGAIILLALSIYFSAKKINGVCEDCKINLKRLK